MAEVILNLDNISVQLGGEFLFTGLDWEVQAGRRIGLVGPNGAGKSTLLRVLAGEMAVDEGNVFRPSTLTIGKLDQEPTFPDDRSVWEVARSAKPEIEQIEQRRFERLCRCRRSGRS